VNRPTLSLKIDACTHAGVRDGVPRLLDLLERRGLEASFFLAFGPDNAGRAALRLWRPSFLSKMLRSGAPGLYGLRTALSGTLLPARPMARSFPELLRRIAAGGHDVALHGWNHRLWQDRLDALSAARIDDELRRAYDACMNALAREPDGTGAPAWHVTPRSLAAQDRLGLRFASDLRGGGPCRLRADGAVLRTVQIPTTGPCVEELLAIGMREPRELASALVAALRREQTAVLAVHAEVEGGRYAEVLERVLDELVERPVVKLSEIARTLVAAPPLERNLVRVELPGRSGLVSSSHEVRA
jgi:peptidoglycan/xylan/chitin deacetylase (PgdA/CDA1 family)